MIPHLFFAQEMSAPPPGVSSWLSCAFWILGGVYLVLKIVEHFRKPPTTKLPQPFTVRAETRYATFAELEEAKKEAKDRHTQFERRASEFRKQTEDKLRLIDEHVNGIPHKVIALLRDTRGLFPPN